MHTNTRFFSRILLPSLAAILLFLVSIYLFVIPNYRESLMDRKRETIRELTNTAWSVMQKLDLMVDDDFSIAKAKNEAALIIGDMRYGDELKDYFWITDTTPRMIVHPYRPSMIGMDLSEYRDTRGKNFFVDIVNIVKSDGDGYVDYKWQWKDDSLTVVSKLSYVKAYEPWGWIVGTGIYIEDVNREITNLTRKVVWISIFITLLVGAIITYLARKNYVADLEREKAQERLRDSMERYKKLVEAATDGVLMMIDNQIVYCNPYLLNLLNYSQDDFDRHDHELFATLESFTQLELSGKESGTEFTENEVPAEHNIRKKDGKMTDVVVSRSKFEMAGKKGYIFTVKDVSRHRDVERELDLNIEKIKSIAGLMNLGMFRCTAGRKASFVDINSKALGLLGYASQAELANTHVQELFDVSAEKKEVIQAVSEALPIRDRLLRLRRADGTILPVLLSLFPVNDAQGKTVFYDGIIIDAYKHLHRTSDFENNTSTMHLSANILLHPVKDYLRIAPVCDMDTTVSTASKLMKSARSEILLIVNQGSTVVGLVTHSDISRRVVAVGADTSIAVSEIMSAPVISVSEDDMVMDAFSLMVQCKVSYIVVKSAVEPKAAYISLLNLSELRRDTPEFLLNTIRKAGSAYEIGDAMKQLPRLIKNLVETGTGVATIGKLISKVSDTVTEKLIKDTISILGEPPAPFVFMVLGSEGRKEQTLATDQDNAIVYKAIKPGDEEICSEYFLELGKRVCTALNTAGYPLCKGGVMAMNKEWCKGINEWKKSVTEWIEIPNPQEILNISIFFDFRPVYGDFGIASSLQDFCHSLLKDKGVFFFNLAQSIVNLKISTIDVSLKNKEMFDSKVPILAITSIARLWALKFGIGERNTSERLFVLQSAGILSSQLRQEFDQAFRYLMYLRIRNQLQQTEAGAPVNNDINPAQLAEMDKIMIKKISSTITDHQNRLGMEFRMG